MSDKYGSSLVCPITFALFCDPVIAEDGHTYERTAIIDWIQRNGTSPLTRTSITIDGLRPNHLIRSLVKDFQNELSKRHYNFKLGVHIERNESPFFATSGKSFFDAKWIGYSNGPPIVLMKLFGACAEKEASFYEDLTRHPHIVYTYGLVEPPQQQSTFVMLLQEKAPLGSLHDFLDHRFEKQPNKLLSNILLDHIFIQISNAMIFLSEKEIIHGDLACRNVLVFRIDEDEPNRTLVKLTDFGMSRANNMYSKIDAVQTVIDIVPIRSAAPEVLQSDPVYSEKSDMYAMGVLMWEAFSNGKLPWIEIAKESVIRKKVINGERLSRPENCKSDRHWELLLKCMSQQVNDRPTFRELEKQLTEFLTPITQSTISDICQPVSTMEVSIDKEQPVSTMEVSIDKQQPVSTVEVSIDKQQPVSTMDVSIDKQQPVSTMEVSIDKQQPVSTVEVSIDKQQPVSTVEISIDKQQPVSTVEVSIDKQQPVSTVEVSIDKQQPVSTMEVSIDKQQLVSTMEISIDKQQSVSTMEVSIDKQQPVSTMEVSIDKQQPVSTVKVSIDKQQPETKEIIESPKTSIIINESDQTDFVSSNEIPQTPPSSGVNVKERCKFFQQQIHKQPLKSNLPLKSSSKTQTTVRTTPPQELIKLTKWH